MCELYVPFVVLLSEHTSLQHHFHLFFKENTFTMHFMKREMELLELQFEI